MVDVRIPDDEEFRKELKEVLAKPDEWYLERVDRAVKGEISVRRRRGLRVSRKG
jgi:hypothetical protein